MVVVGRAADAQVRRCEMRQKPSRLIVLFAATSACTGSKQIATRTGDTRTASEPTLIEVGMDYSIAARRLESRGKTEGSSALDMRYTDDVIPHAWDIGPKSLMLVLVDKQSGRIHSISVCHTIDQTKAFREWLTPMKYDLSDKAPNRAD